MTDMTTSHHTIVVKRTYDATCARVYAAWRDPSALQRRYVPGDDKWTSQIKTRDERRICFSMTIAREKMRVSTSMVTIEFAPHGERTHIRVTDQVVILDGNDKPEDRERGLGETLDKLPARTRPPYTLRPCRR